jgi:hypothetical protein
MQLTCWTESVTLTLGVSSGVVRRQEKRPSLKDADTPLDPIDTELTPDADKSPLELA